MATSITWLQPCLLSSSQSELIQRLHSTTCCSRGTSQLTEVQTWG
jgi:hypothetical protein